MSNAIVSYTEAIRQATEQSMALDPRVFVIGLGVSYKNGADGTMGTLKEQFPTRVLDVPVSEFANTGVAVGASLNGMRPIVHHARVEFGLFAIDQIVTQAAKWNYMFGGGNPVPCVFRLAVGRQWGNGPQHTQALYSLFGSVPGLKVVIPSSPYMAKGLLCAAVADNNPVVYMEPRWLYGLKESVPSEYYTVPLDHARIVRHGTDITIVSYGDGVIDSIRAADYLKQFKISVEVVDMVSINPIDYVTIEGSVRNTRRLLFVDTTHSAFGVGKEVIGELSIAGVVSSPKYLSAPDVPCPTSTSLTEEFYPTYSKIVDTVARMFGVTVDLPVMKFEDIHILPKIEVSTNG
jgi:pyruvate dehydrogenase E1 component beta subunit